MMTLVNVDSMEDFWGIMASQEPGHHRQMPGQMPGHVQGLNHLVQNPDPLNAAAKENIELNLLYAIKTQGLLNSTVDPNLFLTTLAQSQLGNQAGHIPGVATVGQDPSVKANILQQQQQQHQQLAAVQQHHIQHLHQMQQQLQQFGQSGTNTQVPQQKIPQDQSLQQQ